MCRHSPVTESHNRAVPSNDDLRDDSVIWSIELSCGKEASYVANSSFVPAG